MFDSIGMFCCITMKVSIVEENKFHILPSQEYTTWQNQIIEIENLFPERNLSRA